ncbi:MAG: acetate--CoA ligase family protein, partial [Acidimicrobiales bacterium]|nr:acetate--CoA ligase family protein [Acidimicrobiales bacterium]
GFAGLAPAAQRVVDDGEAAVAAARELGFPVAVKASGLDRLSKTEAGGVSLDVHGDDEVRDAHRRMHDLLGEAMEPAVIQVMVPEGVECRIGVHRHQVLGDLITLGPGGSAVERVAHEAMQLLPLTDADAERLLERSLLGDLVDAEGAGARPALVDLLQRVAALADAAPEIVAVRLNPVLVVDGAAAITDVRIGIAPHTPDSRPPVRRL